MKWALVGLGALLLLAVAVVVTVPYLVDTPKIHGTIAQAASRALGRPVGFASLSLSFVPLPALRLRDLSVAEDPKFGSAPFLAVREGRLGLRLWPLFSGRVEVAELTLDGPRVALIQEPGGRWNVQSLGARPPGAPPGPKGAGPSTGGASLPPVSRIRVVGGAVSYEARRPEGAPTTYRLEGLSLTASGDGVGAPINVTAEARLTPGDLRLKVVDGRLSPEAGRPFSESSLNADLELRADDVASLVQALLGPGREVAGPVRGTLALSGSLSRPVAEGEIELSRLTVSERRAACPEPKVRSLGLEAVRLLLSYTPVRLTSRPLSARLASGSATVALTLELGPQPFVRLSEISIKALPLAPVLRDYLCHGYAVSAPLDLAGDLSARPRDPWRTLSGQGQLKLGAGRVVGPDALALLGGVVRMGSALTRALKVDLPPSLFVSPLEFDSITATYRIADGRVTTTDLLYSSPRFKVAAAGEYGLADGRMDLELALQSGTSELTARVTGTASAPAVRVRTPRRMIEAGPARLRQFLRGLTGRPR